MALVNDVYGVQLLGPKRGVEPPPGTWEVRNLGGGKRLVSSRDPEAWFARNPALQTLQQSREDFGTVVAPLLT